MNILQRLQRLLRYAGVSREEYESIAPEISAYNRKRMLAFTGVTIFFLTAMTVITWLNPGLGFPYLIYLIPLTGIQHLAFAALVMIGGGVTALFSHMLRRRVARLHEAQG